MRHFTKNQRGVTPVISTMLLVVIMLVIVSVVMAYGLPMIQDRQSQNTMNIYLRNMQTLELDLEKSIYNGIGYQSSNQLRLQHSELTVNNDAEKWVLYYSFYPTINITYTGLADGDSFFDIATSGRVSFPDFRKEECIARIEVIEPSPKVPGEVMNLQYVMGFNYDVELEDIVKISILFHQKTISEVWIFTQGIVESKVSADGNTYKMALANGGLLSTHPQGKYVKSEPFFREDHLEGTLALSLVHIQARLFSQISTGEHEIGFQVMSEKTLSTRSIYNLHIEIVSDWASAWTEYLSQNFEEHKGGLSDFSGFYPTGQVGELRYLSPVSSKTDSPHPNQMALKLTSIRVDCIMG